MPVFGLYAAFANMVSITYDLRDGSSRNETLTIATGSFDDPCGLSSPEVLTARTSARLSYDFFLVRSACRGGSPVVLDTDGNVRWAGVADAAQISSAFFDGAIYQANGTQLLRTELDGTVILLADFAPLGVTLIDHNFDRGKDGLILEANTGQQFESLMGEVDATGAVVKSWDMAAIITSAMIAGGDDPAQFVRPAPVDWFHMNSAVYWPADDSLLVSSRENFVICLDYNTGAIKWILGDPTKAWYQFASLRKFALALSPGTHAPIGEHALSITSDGSLLLFDNGTPSLNHTPNGEGRTYSAARKYRIDTSGRLATEIATYDNGQALLSDFCSSVYQDENNSYLIDYAHVAESTGGHFAQLKGLSETGETVFDYRYKTRSCEVAYNSVPLHWENLMFDVSAGSSNPTPTPSPSDGAHNGGTTTPTPDAVGYSNTSFDAEGHASAERRAQRNRHAYAYAVRVSEYLAAATLIPR